MFDGCINCDDQCGTQAKCHLSNFGCDTTTAEDLPVQVNDDHPISSPKWQQGLYGENESEVQSNQNHIDDVEPTVAPRSGADYLNDEPPPFAQRDVIGSAQLHTSDIVVGGFENDPIPEGPADYNPSCCYPGCYVPGKRIDEAEVMKRTCWLTYCCCMGCGYSGLPAQMRLVSKCICCRTSCESTPVFNDDDGACHQFQNCCLCSSLCQLPPQKGSSLCVCCGEPSFRTFQQEKARARTSNSSEDVRKSSSDYFLYDQTPLCYCCGFGVAVYSSYDVFYSLVSKCGCCRGTCSTTYPIDEEGLCFALLTCRWLYMQCRFPVNCTGNPVCGFCGWRLRSKPATKSVLGQKSSPVSSAIAKSKNALSNLAAPSPPPTQQEMT